MSNKYERQAEIFKALSNPVRLEVIDVLLDGEKCACLTNLSIIIITSCNIPKMEYNNIII